MSKFDNAEFERLAMLLVTMVTWILL